MGSREDGIAIVDPATTLVPCGHVSAADHRGLVGSLVVSSMNARCHDAAGWPVGGLDGRTIILTWRELRRDSRHGGRLGRGQAEAQSGALAIDAIEVLAVDESIGHELAA